MAALTNYRAPGGQIGQIWAKRWLDLHPDKIAKFWVGVVAPSGQIRSGAVQTKNPTLGISAFLDRPFLCLKKSLNITDNISVEKHTLLEGKGVERARLQKKKRELVSFLFLNAGQGTATATAKVSCT